MAAAVEITVMMFKVSLVYWAISELVVAANAGWAKERRRINHSKHKHSFFIINNFSCNLFGGDTGCGRAKSSSCQLRYDI